MRTVHRTPTVRQVAEACGVSPMTVSYVLNQPARVGVETRERVLQAMRELGYRPTARGHGRHTSTLGVVSGLPNDPANEYSYLRLILGGICSGANQRHQNVTVFATHLWFEDIHRSVRTFCDGRCDGLLVVAPSPDDPLLSALRERAMPFVILGDTSRADCVGLDVDNREAARVAVGHLLALGHRRVAMLKGLPGHAGVELRQAGYEQAHHDFGVPLTRSLIIEGAQDQEMHQARDLLSRSASDRPTALFCGNDDVAATALCAARELGLAVPGDVSVVGFDDGPVALTTDPPLTTVRQPYQRLGERAVEMLLALIGGVSPTSLHELLPTELIVRQSTAAPESPSIRTFSARTQEPSRRS